MVKEPTQKLLLKVAKKHFLAHGFDGARMQAIADDAGTNKSLLHYYYQSKDVLFKEVFKEEGRKMINETVKILDQDVLFLDKIQKIIVHNIDHIIKNPEMPMFMMRETARDPALMNIVEIEAGELLFKRINTELIKAQKNKEVGAHVDIRDLFINMDSLIMYPFIAEVFCRHAFHFKSKKEYLAWLVERKKKLPIFIKQALKPIP